MSSAVNHRKRSHRSHNRAYSAQRTMWAGAARQEVRKQGPFGRFLARFGKREPRTDTGEADTASAAQQSGYASKRRSSGANETCRPAVRANDTKLATTKGGEEA